MSTVYIFTSTDLIIMQAECIHTAVLFLEDALDVSKY